MRKRVAMRLLALALLCPACGATESTDSEAAPTVVVGMRKYRGRYTTASREFLGIEYSRPPTGGLRWFPAQPPLPLGAPTTIDVGKKFGPMCNQDWQFKPNAGGMPLGPNPDGSPQVFGEACLVLNIFTPRNATASSVLPVLVFGHGGGDANGASSMGRPLLLNGSNAVQVVPHVSVTINYRLAAMGYLAHPAFASEPNGSVGNFGLTDHLQALRWVKAHILRFGGDPERVLFYGQSSGANHALWIPLMTPFRGLVQAVAAHSACAQPFFNPDCAAQHDKKAAETTALTYAKEYGCDDGDDAKVRACLRAIPLAQLAKGPSPFVGPAPYYESELLPDLPFEMYQRGQFDPAVKIIAGHNSGESVEMADSCLNNPTLAFNDTLAALGRAFSHNQMAEPAFVAAEAVQYYLPARADGHDACSATGDTATSPAVPRCCQVYEHFWQDLNMQCSEDVLFDAIRAGATKAGVPAPPLYGWRFDAVQQCPPATWGGKPVDSCFHTMDLSWMFATISGFWPWVIPPNNAERWSCSWSQQERDFSAAAIALWVQQAAGAPNASSWAPHTVDTRSRLNLRFGNITAIRDFRKTQCNWWSTIYERIRRLPA